MSHSPTRRGLPPAEVGKIPVGVDVSKDGESPAVGYGLVASSELAGSGGGAATAQVVLFQADGNGQAITDGGDFNLVVAEGVTGFPTSDTAADFIAVNGNGEAIFARDCIVMGTVHASTDNNVASDSPVEVKMGPLTGDRGVLGSGTVASGEAQGDVPLFVGRATEGDTLVVGFTQPGGAANVVYFTVKLWIVG